MGELLCFPVDEGWGLISNFVQQDSLNNQVPPTFNHLYPVTTPDLLAFRFSCAKLPITILQGANFPPH